ncbi:MAG: integrase [Halioglobus sp.]|nr:integrase [Halioglobus sp.]|tara:strand:- start:3814 stop:5082 length:1269 start_codon:yes stop_codon:yes gene_type:complete
MPKHLLTQPYIKAAKSAYHKPAAKTDAAKAKCKNYHSDGGGLYLQVTGKRNAKSWVFKRQEGGKLREVGLGPLSELTLAQARDIAADIWKLTSAGSSLKAARDAVQKEQATEVLEEVGLPAPDAMTFDQCAERFIAEKLTPESKPGSKTVPQWEASLKQYASPHIGSMDVADIGTDDVLGVLQPIWHKVPETASRVRMRIENVLAWATVKGYRSGFNPAVWRGNLSQLLPAKQKVRPVKHFTALPYQDMPALFAELRDKESLTSLALRFTMLTACRTGEVIGAQWSEIDDTKTGIWTIPAERMKAGKPHLVPLSTGAGYVLAQIERKNDWVFPGGNHGRRKVGHMSNIAQLKLLKEMRPGVTVHGFRSAFRDWAAEETDHDNHVAEMALAHTVKGVEGAYRRGALLDKRADLMQDWSKYLGA